MKKPCTYYESNIIDLFIPSFEIFYKFCVIRDKTILVITLIFRTLLYYMVYDYLNTNNYIGYKNKDKIKHYGYIVIVSLLIINIFCLVLALFKFPFIDSSTLSIKNIPELTTKIETRSVGPSEANKTLMPEIITPKDVIKSIS
jgi:hypothetical protein